MKLTSQLELSFDKLACLFKRESNNKFKLDPGMGKGSVQIFRPEKGLLVNIWDCLFYSGIELHNLTFPAEERKYFNLAYFLEPQGLEPIHTSDKTQKFISWNNVFVSSAADFKLPILPMTRYRCVSISFSRKWLLDVLQMNNTLQPLQENFNNIEMLELFQSMTQNERDTLENLFDGSVQNHFRSFYIKAAALKVVCDFLFTLKAEQPSVSKTSFSGILDDVEQYLCEHITKEFTGTKALAQQFSMSESTLKRHFRKKFGVTITAYLTQKKMQYAQELIQEKSITLTEAARIVGYRSGQNFKVAFKKFHNCMPAKQGERRSRKSRSRL